MAIIEEEAVQEDQTKLQTGKEYRKLQENEDRISGSGGAVGGGAGLVK